MPIDLLKTFPFKVRFHKKGMFNLLQWYTQGDGNHVILAKDHPTMVNVWLTILKKHPDAEAKECFRLNTVCPPELMAKRYAEWAHRNELLNFRWRFAGPLRSYKELKKKLPPNISLCKNPRDEDGKVIKKESEYDSGHSMCVNCIDGFLVKGHTYDSLYEKLREELFGEELLKDGKKISEAPLPASGLILYAVTEEPGHHRNGTGVEKVPKWESIGEDDPFPSSVHFFFQGTKLKIPDQVTASIKAGNDAWVARKKKDRVEQKIQNKKYNDDLIKKVDNLLEGL